MAKKTSNPMDAARKAARKRELERNKASRQKVREELLIRKDPRPLQAEVRRLERLGSRASPMDAAELKEKKEELEKMLKLKEEFVAKHPNSRKLVFPGQEEEQKLAKEKERWSRDATDLAAGSNGTTPANLQFGGRIPERSVYYDAVFNPTGAPPPGMPYREKPPDQWPAPPLPSSPPPSWPTAFGASDDAHAGAEDEASASDGQDSTSGSETDEDGIRLPAGPPPLPPAHESDDSSDEDADGIVMPSGPPPSKAVSFPNQSQPSEASLPIQYAGPPPGPGGLSGPVLPQPPIAWPGAGTVAPPPPPGSYPPSRPPAWHPSPSRFRPAPSRPLPRPSVPRGYDAHHAQAGAAGQVRADPMALNGHVAPTYQAWRSRPRSSPQFGSGVGPAAAHPSASGPTGAPTGPSSDRSKGPAPGPPPVRPPTSISAAPQMRDFRKEAAAFVPPALARKRAAQRAQAAKGGLPGIVDAAPGPRSEVDKEVPHQEKIGLMDRLQTHLAATHNAESTHARSSSSAQTSGKKAREDEYEKFLGDIGDLL